MYRWCEPWKKSLVWTGQRWAIDDRRQDDALAKQVAQDVSGRSGSDLPTATASIASELLKFSKMTSNARGLGNMLALRGASRGFRSGLPILTSTDGC